MVSSKNVPKTIWDIINNITIYQQDKAVKQIKVKTGDDVIQAEAEIAHEFNRFFVPVGSGISPRPSETQVIQT